MPFQLSVFINDLEAMSRENSSSDCISQMSILLASVCSNPEDVLMELTTLENFPNKGGALILHQSHLLFLSIFVLAPGQRTAIHDHGMDTAIGILSGKVSGTVYSKKPDQTISNPESVERTSGDVYILCGNQPHDESNTGKVNAIEMHIYPGNVLTSEVNALRSLWGWDNKKYPYTHDKFFELAAEKSSIEIKENIATT